MSTAAIYAWAAAATVRPVIWANQNGPQPASPYVTLQVTAAPQEGDAEVFDGVSGAGLVDIRLTRLWTVQVACFGAGAVGELQELLKALHKITVQQALRAAGTCYVRVLSGPTDVPEVTGTTWQPRAVMDVQFRAAEDYTDDVGLIERVRFTGEADGLTVTREASLAGIDQPQPEEEGA